MADPLEGLRTIPGPDPGACPECGEWRKAGVIHECSGAAVVTPVEERIDHEEAKKLVDDAWIYSLDELPGMENRVTRHVIQSLCGTVKSLLTEHSAREGLVEALRAHDHYPVEDCAACYLALLPATESAQPEEDRTEAWIHSPERESPPVEADDG